MALSQPRALVLDVYEGRKRDATATGLFSSGQPKVRGALNTLRIGDKLHVGVVVAELAEAEQPLSPGLNYSYNVGLAPFNAGAGQAAKLDPTTLTPTADLKLGGLLRDQPICGSCTALVAARRTRTPTTTRATRASTGSPGSTT